MNARKLRALMVLHDDNVTTLAQKLGISRQTLSATLNGRREFRVGEILRIAQLYRMTPTQLERIFFDGSGSAGRVVT